MPRARRLVPGATCHGPTAEIQTTECRENPCLPGWATRLIALPTTWGAGHLPLQLQMLPLQCVCALHLRQHGDRVCGKVMEGRGNGA